MGVRFDGQAANGLQPLHPAPQSGGRHVQVRGSTFASEQKLTCADLDLGLAAPSLYGDPPFLPVRTQKTPNKKLKQMGIREDSTIETFAPQPYPAALHGGSPFLVGCAHGAGTDRFAAGSDPRLDLGTAVAHRGVWAWAYLDRGRGQT